MARKRGSGLPPYVWLVIMIWVAIIIMAYATGAGGTHL
jgi:hypothetical protein